jgi:hypothetical protein
MGLGCKQHKEEKKRSRDDDIRLSHVPTSLLMHDLKP